MAEADDFNSQIIREFRENDGRVGGPFEGAHMLLLHTTGAKSGRERVNPLVYRPVGDSYAVFGSKGGAPTDPQWYRNLVVQPCVQAEIGTQKLPLTARVATGDEREQIWSAHKADNPGFADYERITTRQIPVVILDARQ